jgi:hypothetical protein
LTTGQAARVRGMDEYSGVMSVLPARHPVTADEFERMVEAGVFAIG